MTDLLLVDEDLVRTLDEFFGEEVVTAHASGPAIFPSALWAKIHDLGFDRVGIAEDLGGSGGSITDLLATLMVAARHAIPGPMAEAHLAAWLLAASGTDAGDGLAVSAPHTGPLAYREGRVTGHLNAVPWGGSADHVVALASGEDDTSWVVRLEPAHCSPQPGENLAGEPIVDLTVDVRPVSAAATSVDVNLLFWLGSLCRTAQIAGGIQGVEKLTRAYVAQRTQFGRPVGSFQAVQQHVVCVAQAAELATMALWTAARAWAVRGPEAALDIASAKLVANRCAQSAARAAHQAHGAIGMTREYRLHAYTLRLHLWRHELVTERALAVEIGRAARSLPSFAEAIFDADSSARLTWPTR
jgi:acyl-CoA dehydrogenase